MSWSGHSFFVVILVVVVVVVVVVVEYVSFACFCEILLQRFGPRHTNYIENILCCRICMLYVTKCSRVPNKT